MMRALRDTGPGYFWLLVAVALLGPALMVTAYSTLVPAHTAAAPTNQVAVSRLILRPHTTVTTGHWSNGRTFELSLSPSLPGRNTIHLTAAPGALAGNGDRRVVVATMPGMAMSAILATLTRRGEFYSGTITLPMFGRYALEISTTTGAISGHARVLLSLP